MDSLVSISLRFGNLSKQMIGLSGNVLEQSLLCWIMFQLSPMNPLMFGLLPKYPLYLECLCIGRIYPG